MKKIIPILALILIFSPVLASAQTVNLSNKNDQSLQLITLLLEKVKVLQVQLDVLLKQKNQTVPVEIVSQNEDYKKEVAPLIDLLEEKNEKEELLEVKLEEAKCVKPNRINSGGVIKFSCKNKDYSFSATTTEYVLDDEKTAQYFAKIFGFDEIKVITTDTGIPAGGYGVVVSGKTKDPACALVGNGSCSNTSSKPRNNTSNATILTKKLYTAIIPPNTKVVSITKEIEALDKEIEEINNKIKLIKLRHGV